MPIRFAAISVLVMSLAALVTHAREAPNQTDSFETTEELSQATTAPNSAERENALRPFKQNNYMTLTPTTKINALGNPIYELRLYSDGKLYQTYPTVTGRSDTQTKDRNLAGINAPLPDGIYLVASFTVPGTADEVGDNFLPIEPLFFTNRSELGIHVDPSFEKPNGEDGTSGCIGLTDKSDLDRVLDYVSTYHPEYLEVKIQ